MSYMRMSVYDFSCDGPDPHLLSGHVQCGEYSSLPMFGEGLRGAEKEIRAAGWTVRDGKHYCPAHADLADHAGG